LTTAATSASCSLFVLIMRSDSVSFWTYLDGQEARGKVR